MNAITKINECIKMLGEAQMVFTTLLYDTTQFDSKRIIGYQNRIKSMLDYRLMPFCIISIPDEADKKELRDFLVKHNLNVNDIDNLWYTIQNYPLVKGDDIKDEFWSICPNVESIPKYLDMMLVKFEDVNYTYDADIDKIKDEYNGLNKLVEAGMLTTQEADEIWWNIYFIADRYNFIVCHIVEIFKGLRKMAAKPSEEFQRTETQVSQIRQFTDEQIDLLRGYFVAKFKGMGNNCNYFDDNLLTDLKKNRSGIDYAKIAKLIYESPNAKKEFKNKPFSQWYETFCSIMRVKKCKYKTSQIHLDEDIKKEFYYLI